LDEIIKHHFRWIDEDLAARDTPVQKRVLPAAIRFVEDCVITSNIDPKGTWAPGQATEFVHERWFRIFYSYAERWYRERYGARVTDSGTSLFTSVVLIASTPFELQVPTTLGTPEIDGETLTLSFPPRVSPNEDPLEWVSCPPSFESYTAAELRSAKKACIATSNRIRAISCRLLGANLTDPSARAVLAGVRLHLHSATDLILREGEEGRLPRAQWELQMACESAYKGVLQQHTGAFSEHHDLFMLHQSAKPLTGRVPDEWIRDLPRWNESANLRYGLGNQLPTIFGIVHWYSVSLKIIGGVLDGLKGFKLDKARITLKMPPWLKPYDVQAE
jgi:hypothetical protein